MTSFYRLLLSTVAVALWSGAFGQNCDSNFQGLAEATFSGDIGVDGSVSISANGSFAVDISLEGNLDTSICSGSVFPLQYHIHEKWSYGAEDAKNRYGAACGGEYTGGHYNPYGGPICAEVASPTFYNCEVGDISGRFGEVQPNILGRIEERNVLNDGDCLCGRLTPEMGYTRSVVFHCNDGTRLFCAPFKVEFVAIKEQRDS